MGAIKALVTLVAIGFVVGFKYENCGPKGSLQSVDYDPPTPEPLTPGIYIIKVVGKATNDSKNLTRVLSILLPGKIAIPLRSEMEETDMCKFTECPFSAGDKILRISSNVPKLFPPGRFGVKFDMKNEKQQRQFCFSFDVVVGASLQVLNFSNPAPVF